MNLERERKFYRIYEEAFDKSPEDRDAFLQVACGDDVALLEKLRLYLKNADDLTDDDSFDKVMVRGIQDKVRQALNVDAGSDQEDALVGRTLNHYRVVEVIGRGGMGVVYKAEDLRLNRLVAIKVVPGEMAGSSEYRKRFDREARAIAALNHPNIVTVYSVEEADDLNFITMELVEGRTLAELIPERGLPLKKFLELAVPMADAINAAHMRGLIHRDLKPANIMVNQDGHVKILDFGLARRQASPTGNTLETRLTRRGRMLGTYPYMSPEQVKCQNVDHLSDIFSLGVIFYEMATGDRPFKGESSGELISSILRDSPRSVSVINADLPNHLSRIIIRCLEKNTRQRCQSALDLRNELENLLKDIESGDFLTANSRLFATTGKWKRLPKTCQLRIFVGLVLFLFFGASAYLAYRYIVPEPAAENLFKDVEWIYLEPFHNQTHVPELEYFDVLLREALGQTPHLKLYPENGILEGGKVVRPPEPIDLKNRDHRERLTALNIVKTISGKITNGEKGYSIEIQIADSSLKKPARPIQLQIEDLDKIYVSIEQLVGLILNAMLKPKWEGPIRIIGDPDVLLEYLAGLNAFARGDPDRAIILLKRLVERKPDFAPACSRLSVYLSALGKEDNADYFGRAYKHREHLAGRDRLWVEGNSLMKILDYESARKEFEKVEVLFSPDQYTYRQLTHCYSALGETRKAVEVALQARALSPNSAINIGMAIISLVEDNQFQRAWSEYKRSKREGLYYPCWGGGLALLSMGEPERAREVFEKLKMSRDNFWQSYADLLIAKTHAFQGRFGDAIKVLEDGLYLDNINESPGNIAERKLRLAQLEMLRGDSGAASDQLAFFDGLQAKTEDLRKLREIGLIRLELGDIEAAERISDLLDTIAEEAGHLISKAFASQVKGVLLHTQGEKEALPMLKWAHGRLNDPLITWSLAEYYRKEKKPGDAKSYYQKVLVDGKGHIFREDLPFRWVLAHWRLAECELALGNREAAFEARDKFLALWGKYAPNHPEVQKARKMK